MAEPAYSFTIPSIEDDTQLDCRIYHPRDLQAALSDDSRQRGGIRGAIVAHPYAPLGGCYDDSVVISVSETLLEDGFIVGTFNFRGAGGSQGRTTLTGKSEQDDYASFAGFVTYYLQALTGAQNLSALSPIQLEVDHIGPSKASHENIQLVLGGYSYGSLVLARLPAITTIIQRFDAAEMRTAGAEIVLRARTLAKQTRHSFDVLHSPTSLRGRRLRPDDAATSPTKRFGTSPIIMGGEETDPSTRRRSKDSRRSIDLVRKSVELPRRIKAHVSRSTTPTAVREHENEDVTPILPTLRNGPTVTARYLVISPVLLPFTQTLCPPGSPSLLSGIRTQSPADSRVGACFSASPTLAIFGSTDGFTSSRRLKAWAEKQSSDSKSTFEWLEIEGAGHFWRENGAMTALQKRISAWANPSQ